MIVLLKSHLVFIAPMSSEIPASAEIPKDHATSNAFFVFGLLRAIVVSSTQILRGHLFSILVFQNRKH
jgi:hypothetical protein